MKRLKSGSSKESVQRMVGGVLHKRDIWEVITREVL